MSSVLCMNTVIDLQIDNGNVKLQRAPKCKSKVVGYDLLVLIDT